MVGQTQFVNDRCGAEREVITVADVDRGVAPHLTGSSATDISAGLDIATGTVRWTNAAVGQPALGSHAIVYCGETAIQTTAGLARSAWPNIDGDARNARLQSLPGEGPPVMGRHLGAVALGGGVIGDLVGFAAAVLRRGVRFVQVPTSLLAQVDSSVGGKTGINSSQGKNLIGAFHQPSLVLADIDVLDSLPQRDLLAGYGEVVKYGLLGDKAFFEWCEKKAASLLACDAAALKNAVTHSCRMKAAIVAEDEREQGRRALLNLGHTFGHALEAETGYSDRLLHGESVATGLVLAFALAAELQLASHDDARRVEAHIAACALPARIAGIAGLSASPDKLIAHMRHDKKAKDGKLVFIVPHGIGDARIHDDVPLDAVARVLSRSIALPA